MTKTNLIYLKGNIPIRIINEPYCQKCMDNVDTGKNHCKTCKYPHPIVNDWYFNKVRCIGKYKYYGGHNFKIPINILSILVSLLKYKKKI